MKISTDTLQAAFQKRGYYWHNQLNLIGIRTKALVADKFNDFLVCSWTQPAMETSLPIREKQKFLNVFGFTGKDGLPLKEDGDAGSNTTHALGKYFKTVGLLQQRIYVITTDPGSYYLENPLNGGCAVVCPGQYKNVWRLGFHQGKTDHPALVQHGGPITIWRDTDRDKLPEAMGKPVSGFFGINCHRASLKQVLLTIGQWSAGCQVMPKHRDHQELLDICAHFEKSLQNLYTYTLLEEKDL